MIAVESNVLIYAHKEGARDHSAAVRAVGRLMSDASPWAIRRPCLHEFYGISELWTADRDFTRFPALKTHNPLVTTG